jgi:predicted transglutaminase-like cysteine proteinase
MRRIGRMLLGGIAALTTAGAAQAQSPAAMPLGRATSAPAGYLAFCARQPGECRELAGQALTAPALTGFWREAFATDQTSAVSPVEGASAPRQALSADALPLLNAVNREVNGAIAPADDRGDDLWSLPLAEGRRTGDCEDYVLEKRRALIARGVPAQTLSIAVARTLSGETHAVLVAATKAGELVLDNRSPWIVAWNETGYRWVKRQAPGDPAHWVRVAAY